ncbi:MAG: CrcB family protein [Firmicutes bacterium]|nr:CrcB family protein [Bacillota bacterium]
MEQNKEIPKQLSAKQKLHILFGTLAGLGVGSVLGVIAYYQHWLG